MARKTTKKARIFYPCRTPKILGKERKNAQKCKEFLEKEKSKEIQKSKEKKIRVLLENQAFGGRRKPQIFAENRRKPQIGLRHLRCVTFSSALEAFYLQLELFRLQLSFFTYSLLRCFLDTFPL